MPMIRYKVPVLPPLPLIESAAHVDDLREEMPKAAEQLQRAIQKRTPVKTGLLRSMIKVTPVKVSAQPRDSSGRFSHKPATGETEIVADTHYASYVEHGTRFMAPRRYIGKTLEKDGPRIADNLAKRLATRQIKRYERDFADFKARAERS